MRREETLIAILNFFGLPLIFLSAILIAEALMPGWMQWAARFNPVNWGVVAAREMSSLDTDWARVGLYLGLLLAFVAATSALATRAFRVYRRTRRRKSHRRRPGSVRLVAALRRRQIDLTGCDRSPGATERPHTTPARCAVTSFSIFIASTTQITWPAVTSSPSATSTASTVPCIGLTTASRPRRRLRRRRRSRRRRRAARRRAAPGRAA